MDKKEEIELEISKLSSEIDERRKRIRKLKKILREIPSKFKQMTMEF